MGGYSKLFSDIITSSIWSEDDKTRIVWITMLALKDSAGVVSASVPGLANAARVTIPESEAALAKLEAPDKYSRTSDNDGRRIEKVEGGWLVLNHEKYRDKYSAEDRKQYKRHWQSEWREQQKHNGIKKEKKDQPVQTVQEKKKQADLPIDFLKASLKDLAEAVIASRMEFKGRVHVDTILNILRSERLDIARVGTRDFCRDMANALEPPNNPPKLLAGYLRRARLPPQCIGPQSAGPKSPEEIDAATQERAIQVAVESILAVESWRGVKDAPKRWRDVDAVIQDVLNGLEQQYGKKASEQARIKASNHLQGKTEAIQRTT